MSDVFRSAWRGRWVRLESAPPAGSFVAKAAEGAFRPWDRPSPIPETMVGWCTSMAPNSGDLAEESDPMGYVIDVPTGVGLGWLRVETRTPSRPLVIAQADRIAKERYKTPFMGLRGDDKRDALERARDLVRATTSPKVRVLPVMIVGDMAWIGAGGRTRGMIHTLGGVFGKLDAWPGVWEESDPDLRFFATTQALLGRFLDRGDGTIAPGVLIDEMTLDDTTLRLRAKDCTADRVRKLIEEGMRSSDRPDVRSILASVDGNDAPVTIGWDSDGVTLLNPASSSGGLDPERVRRRFDDAMGAVDRLREALHAAAREHVDGKAA
jgi:hypothetical protein